MIRAESGFIFAGVVFIVMGCSSSDDTPAPAPAAPAADNVPLAPSTLCAEMGRLPTTNQSSCAEAGSPPTVADADKNGFCQDRRFGTFFFASDGLYFCAAPSKAVNFPFGEQYGEAIVIKTDDDIIGFAHGSANNYRCYQQNGPSGNKQNIDNQSTALELNKDLCNTGISAVATNPTTITHGGHTYRLASFL